MWLDRGELDKIIDRVDSGTPDRSDRTRNPGRNRAEHHDRYDDDHDDDDRYERVAQGDGRPKRKRGGFLGELFELGG
ncbi:MAG: hypothetical protein ACR2HP_00125 [Ilumatobacteraceae bacterium]